MACGMVVGNMILDPAAQCTKQLVNSVHLGFEFGIDPGTTTGWLSFEVDTWSIVASTP